MECPCCGVVHDRDYNAAINILEEGLRGAKSICNVTVGRDTPEPTRLGRSRKSSHGEDNDRRTKNPLDLSVGSVKEAEMNEKIAALQENDMAKEHQKGKARRRLQRIRQRQRNDRLLRILDHGGYAPHRGYVDGWFDDQMQWHTSNYIKYPKNSNCQRWLKRETSHRTRRCRKIPKKGNYYRRLFDYWWNMY